VSLVEESIRRLLRGQHPSGAFVASPDFPTYRYAWLRDGTFCAYALDRWGQHAAAEGFHRWVGQTVRRRRQDIRQLLEQRRAGLSGDPRLFPPARYTLEGELVGDDWPNLQLDGYGTWLWGLREHTLRSGDSRAWDEAADAVALCTDYLEAFWDRPCYDCWEERGELVPPSTLACLYGGLDAVAAMTGRVTARQVAEAIHRLVMVRGVQDGHLIKSLGDPQVDASLLWAAVPFGLVDPDGQLARQTARRIQEELSTGCGVRRYVSGCRGVVPVSAAAAPPV